MAELIGFLIVFAVLAAIVAFLAQGVARIVGFVILAALAVIIGTPTIREGLPELSNFFGQGSENQAIEAAPNTVPPGTDNPDATDGTTTTNPDDGTNPNSATGGGGGGTTTTGGTASPRPARTPQPALW